MNAVALDGSIVGAIFVQRSLSRPPRQFLLGTLLVADCASVDEVARYVDLGSLVPQQHSA